MMTNGSMPGCQQSPNDQNSNWKEGCLGKFTRTLAYYKSVVIGVVAGIDIVLVRNLKQKFSSAYFLYHLK